MPTGDRFDTVGNICTHHRKAFDKLFCKERNIKSDHNDPNVISAQDSDSAVEDLKSNTTPTLSDSEIDAYLHRYQSLQKYFPFLHLPDDWSVQAMKNSHPFYLLGILAAMTQHELPLNAHIHKQFCRVLAERVLVRAERSLDLVQGMVAQLSR